MNFTARHTLKDFESDAKKVPVKAARGVKRVVERNVTQGNRLAQGIAKRNSGPHGTAYWKRITSEMTGPLQGEFGPHGDVVGNAVGGGWRHGPPNMDLPKAADIIGRRFASEAASVLDGVFW